MAQPQQEKELIFWQRRAKHFETLSVQLKEQITELHHDRSKRRIGMKVSQTLVAESEETDNEVAQLLYMVKYAQQGQIQELSNA